MAKTGAQRQKESEERQREAGYIQRRVWATEEEHVKIKELLAEWHSTEKKES